MLGKDSPLGAGGGQRDLNSFSEERISGPPELSNRSGDTEVAMVRGLVTVVATEESVRRWVGLLARWVEPGILGAKPVEWVQPAKSWAELLPGEVKLLCSKECIADGEGSLLRGRREGWGEGAEEWVEEGVEHTCWEYGGVLNCGVSTVRLQTEKT